MICYPAQQFQHQHISMMLGCWNIYCVFLTFLFCCLSIFKLPLVLSSPLKTTKTTDVYFKDCTNDQSVCMKCYFSLDEIYSDTYYENLTPTQQTHPLQEGGDVTQNRQFLVEMYSNARTRMPDKHFLPMGQIVFYNDQFHRFCFMISDLYLYRYHRFFKNKISLVIFELESIATNRERSLNFGLCFLADFRL